MPDQNEVNQFENMARRWHANPGGFNLEGLLGEVPQQQRYQWYGNAQALMAQADGAAQAPAEIPAPPWDVWRGFDPVELPAAPDPVIAPDGELDLELIYHDTENLVSEWGGRASPFLASDNGLAKWLNEIGVLVGMIAYRDHVRHHVKRLRGQLEARGLRPDRVLGIGPVDVARAILSVNHRLDGYFYCPMGLDEAIDEPNPDRHIAYSWAVLLDKSKFPIVEHENKVHLSHHMGAGQRLTDLEHLREILLYMPFLKCDKAGRKPSIVLNPYHSKPVPLP